MVKEWPEVFEDLYMNTMPLAYLEVINLEFANGRVWQINVREQMTNSNLDRMSDKLFDILQEYKKDIIKIDFRINVLRLKEDIAKLTSSIL
jgi:beta-xylosidase